MTQEIKEYTNSIIFDKLFDDVIELVQESSDYLDGIGLFDKARLGQKEQNKFVNQTTELTNTLMKVSEFLLNLRTYSKNETETLKNIVFKPYIIDVDHNLPFKFNMLLTQSKHLYDRVIRIDQQFKNDNKSYFKNLTISL